MGYPPLCLHTESPFVGCLSSFGVSSARLRAPCSAHRALRLNHRHHLPCVSLKQGVYDKAGEGPSHPGSAAAEWDSCALFQPRICRGPCPRGGGIRSRRGDAVFKDRIKKPYSRGNTALCRARIHPRRFRRRFVSWLGFLASLRLPGFFASGVLKSAPPYSSLVELGRFTRFPRCHHDSVEKKEK